MESIEEDGVLRWVEVPTEGGWSVWKLVTSKAERNRLRAKGVVPKWLRWQLERMEREGTIDTTGIHLLELEREKGGRKRKIPMDWLGPKVTGEFWERLKRDFTAYGRLQELSKLALDELGLDVELTETDIWNARREWGSRD